jgi:hypothetical protein
MSGWLDAAVMGYTLCVRAVVKLLLEKSADTESKDSLMIQ